MRCKKGSGYRSFAIPHSEYANPAGQPAKLRFEQSARVHRSPQIAHIDREYTIKCRKRFDATPLGAELLLLRLPDLIAHSGTQVLPVFVGAPGKLEGHGHFVRMTPPGR